MKQVTPAPFDTSAADYDNWFERHTSLFQNEYKALRLALPKEGIGVEIGTGTGRFAEVLKIPFGVEPSHAMAQMAIARRITVIKAKAEELPFRSLSFDYAVRLLLIVSWMIYQKPLLKQTALLRRMEFLL